MINFQYFHHLKNLMYYKEWILISVFSSWFVILSLHFMLLWINKIAYLKNISHIHLLAFMIFIQFYEIKYFISVEVLTQRTSGQLNAILIKYWWRNSFLWESWMVTNKVPSLHVFLKESEQWNKLFLYNALFPVSACSRN